MHIQKCLIMILVVVTSACSRAEFDMYSDNTNQNAGTGVSTPVICDPFAPGNIVSAISGLKGSIYYLDQTQKRYTSSLDYLKYGQKINAEIFLNDVFVPTRAFDAGFTTDDSITLKDDAGKTLVEYFGLELRSSLKLGATDSTGLYQLALLSDDGSTLLADDGTGKLAPLVKNEGDHATRMGCATEAIELDAKARLPISLSYYQGPRNHVSLVMMWRKVAKADDMKDVSCGKTLDYFKYDSKTKTSVPQDAYKQLLSRGWKPVSAQNFELADGYNKCI